MKKIIFLCTANSCRSQMAEGFAKKYFPNLSVFSAGTKPSTVNHYAIGVMQEVGIDLSSNTSKSILSLKDITFDVAITVCNNAKENCPVLPGVKIVHKSFRDPPELAASFEKEEDKINCFREVRDEIEHFIKNDLEPYLNSFSESS